MIQRLLLLILFFSPLSLASEMPKGALCLIATDNSQVVMLREVLTGKLSLPGGTIEAGEDPKLAAQRETWEETGLVVTVGDEAYRNEKAIYYDCVSDSEVIAYTTQTEHGHYLVPAWFAPHFGIEMNQVMLANPDYVEDYRYSYHLYHIKKAIPDLTHHKVRFIEHASEAAPSLYAAQLPYLVVLQDFVLQSEGLKFVVILLDALASPVLLLVAMIVLYSKFSKAEATMVAFAVSIVSLLALVAQVGLSIARPWAYMPSLQTSVVDLGFGAPSLATAVMVTLFGLSYRLYAEARLVSPMLVIVLLQGFASIILGNQFFLDIVLGAVLGGLVVWHFVRTQAKVGSKFKRLFESSMIWWALSALCVVLVVMWQRPEFAFWLALSLSLAAIHMTLLPNDSTKLSHVATGGLVLIGIIIIAVAAWGQVLASSSSFLSFIMLVAPYPCAALVCASVFKIMQR
ncbi:NUDIX domain-containing protein [Vibrio sp. SCSIO 43136]|uniref:bifunctional NUDIX hydrolase/phosphatase PAP2 family protein n=1 Tax=Vibrio sp. SCSIO 43136 TaxID=2819101 RepID=UPI00207533CF|nr:NUDIX domain-containing protein [Vibrio sp. SCSIO 43136]USD66494.1 NUDIX domain-containing protein [Vibrio sp. SCSIO 43136]